MKNCENCGLTMNLIDDGRLWFCPFGCTKIAVDPTVTFIPRPPSLSHFLSMFFDEDEPVYLFALAPKAMPDEIKPRHQPIRTTYAELATNRVLQRRLVKLNEDCGIYFTVNRGGTKKHEIDRINAVFCEIDDLPVADQHDLFDNAPLPPSIRVETGKSVHAYWLPSEIWTIEQFHTLQTNLIAFFNSDPAIKNENRLMRLPFFNHVTYDEGELIYKKVALHTFSNTAFTFAELNDAYPEPTAPHHEPVAHREFNQRETAWQKLFAEMADRFRLLEGFSVEPGGKLASARGVCHHGDTNRTLVMNLQTGVIFCRAGCEFDDILRGLNLERPQKPKPRFIVPRVAAPINSSRLYQSLVGGAAK